VIGEIGELTFAASRRLQLAEEKSHVTGFIHRYDPKTEDAVACVTRWKIKPLPSLAVDGLPGLGKPRWNVELHKVRNGQPGTWQVEWAAGLFQPIPKLVATSPEIPKLRTG
jgi:protein ImuA